MKENTRCGAKGVNGIIPHEMTDDDHRALAIELRRISGMAIVCGYACELYDVELYADWERVELDTVADGGRKRTEVLWLNSAATSARSPLMAIASNNLRADQARAKTLFVPQTITD